MEGRMEASCMSVDENPPGDFSPEKLEAHVLSLEDERTKREAKNPRIELRKLSDFAADIVAQSSIPEMDYGVSRLNALAPIQMRSMATLVGPTGAGKTALALTLASHRARYADKPTRFQGPCAYFLFELTCAQFAARRAAQLSRFTQRQILGGIMTERELETTLVGEHFYVFKPPRGIDFIEYASRCLDEIAKTSPGVPLLVADYLQRIKGQGRDMRETMSNTVDNLVDLIESRDMYGLLLSKGSRGGSKMMRDGKTRGEELVDASAETSAIEAGSAAVLAITYENRDGSDTTDMRIEIAKGRFGATGANVGMRFHGPSGRWEELDEVPLTNGERTAEEAVLAALSLKPEGYESRNALVAATKGNRQQVLSAVRRLLNVQRGKLEIRDGRVVRRGN
jgi:replicative DNA helicase